MTTLDPTPSITQPLLEQNQPPLYGVPGPTSPFDGNPTTTTQTTSSSVQTRGYRERST